MSKCQKLQNNDGLTWSGISKKMFARAVLYSALSGVICVTTEHKIHN